MTAPNVLARLRRLEAAAGTGSAEDTRRADDRARAKLMEKLARLAAVVRPDPETADPARLADVRERLLALRRLRDAARPAGVADI